MVDILAGYISGSTVDLARVRSERGKVALSKHRGYVASDFPDFESILDQFVKNAKTELSVACFGVAGPVISDVVSLTNLDWHIEAAKLEKQFGFDRVQLVNDLVATAHGLSQLNPDKHFIINEGKPVVGGNLGLIAAGAGLGEALIHIDDNGKHYPYASEGGHADFAPGNQLETELWQYLYSELGRVEAEDVVSVAGLERIYNFLVDTQSGVRSEWFRAAKDRPMAIVEKALAGADETASRTLDLFIDCYASEAANLALKGMTLGGIYIGGPIAPQIITAIDNGRFMERFIKHGKMESILASMPVGVIIEDKTALLGAASVALGIR
ncbi:glucokinase [candidate division GN15 bacterium]|nr:glucokinase [candidate division GN15 bacterium]